MPFVETLPQIFLSRECLHYSVRAVKETVLCLCPGDFQFLVMLLWEENAGILPANAFPSSLTKATLNYLRKNKKSVPRDYVGKAAWAFDCEG